MGTTAQKLQYLVNAKAAIDTALTNKGVTPPTALADYGTAIGTLGYKNKLQQIVDRTVTEITAEDLAGCTEIGNYLFYGCTRLTSIMIPDSVTSIGHWAVSYCTRLTSITIPGRVTSIANYLFYNCAGLKNVTIQDGVKTIQYAAFYGCTDLTSITIPDSITSIGGSVFYGCTGLTSITILATTPPTLLSSDAFNSTNNCPIYVPAASVDTYKAATNWSSLTDRIFAIQE